MVFLRILENAGRPDLFRCAPPCIDGRPANPASSVSFPRQGRTPPIRKTRSPNVPLPELIEGLLKPEAYPHDCEYIELIETHISWVLLTGEFAYKVKKPVDLGFLDYRGLERRKFYCKEELRLNRRLAPDLYLDVATVAGPVSAPRIGGPGNILEYAVRMRQFSQQDLLPERMKTSPLDADTARRLAHRVATFHDQVAVAPLDSPWGTPRTILDAMEHNFSAVRENLPDPGIEERMVPLELWTLERHAALTQEMETRKTEGYIRECHGDMHLGNVAMIDGEVTLFDGIEFNPGLRWIDVISELAFLLMDLDDRGAQQAARRVLNAYLQGTGDYGGLALLRLYQVYRAMVRAKVSAIRASQASSDTATREHAATQCGQYVELADRYTRTRRPFVWITHGLSGSGKSTACSHLVEHTDAIWLRSDLERKRLFGMTPVERGQGGIDEGIYSAGAGQRVYGRLVELSRELLEAGFAVIVDATFLNGARRHEFRELARIYGMDFRILDLQADIETLRTRIRRRAAREADPSDADERVLEYQLEHRDLLTRAERADVTSLDTAHLPEPGEIDRWTGGN